MRTPHDVYRVFDAHGALLYVGLSRNAFKRISEHKSEHQPWWPDARTFSVTRYADKRSGRYHEALAIGAERPRWNIRPETSALASAPHIHREPIEPTETFPINCERSGDA